MERTWTVTLDGQAWARGATLERAAKAGARMMYHFPEWRVLLVCDQEPEHKLSVLDAWVLLGEHVPT